MNLYEDLWKVKCGNWLWHSFTLTKWTLWNKFSCDKTVIVLKFLLKYDEMDRYLNNVAMKVKHM